MADLERLRFVRDADVYKGGQLAGRLSRTEAGGTVFAYDGAYVGTGGAAVATTLPVDSGPVESPAGALPAFFAGLLPEGHRLSVLRGAAKTSLNDELTLLLAVGADVPGDTRIVPAGEAPVEPVPLADAVDPETLDFAVLAGALDLHGLPGVQDKASASMLTAPLALRRHRYILKLDPPGYAHLVENENAHLRAARALKLPVAAATVITDRAGLKGLLVERFDRVSTDGTQWTRLALEDGAQVLGLPPAAKYTVPAEEVVQALAGACRAPMVAVRNLYLQFLFAWLSGNGDLHAKNVSILGTAGRFTVAPIYDVPCTLVYGDDSMALSITGRTKGLRARHWEEFAEAIGLPQRAAASAAALALRAAAAVDLSSLPFAGSPLRGAERELRHRRAELQA
jgi:serine/threonine-protein kinase HipA